MLANFDWMQALTGSPIFVALVLFSIVTLGVAIERAIYFSRRRDNPDETLTRVLDKIDKQALREASWACETCAHPMGPVGVEMFKHVGKKRESVEERMQIALSGQKLLLERNLNILGTMAAIAPLVGLLGTVWGIMRAFFDMAQTGSAAPSVVAAGVAEALVTTAAGLIVAVPALMLYNHFARRMNVMLTIAENHVRTMRAAVVEGPSPAPQSKDQTPTKPGQPVSGTPQPQMTS